MIAAVFCPGPSLVRFRECEYADARYDFSWVINTAIKLIPADWLSGGDIAAYDLAGSHRPRIGVLATPDTARAVLARTDWAGLCVKSWDSVPWIGEQQTAGHPINWSMQAALLHAGYLGARQIDLFGCDLTGGPDCTGYAGEDRTPDRWAREIIGLHQTIQYLAIKGVVVNKVDL